MKRFFQLSISSDRIFGLDMIRALAIIFVVLMHTGKFIPKEFQFYYKKILFDGVGIFFVLSGFLIGGILIKQIEKYKFDFKALLYFWSKRWSRTLPNYYLFYFISLFIAVMTISDFEIKNTFRHLIFAQNFTTPSIDFFAHSWSLSVEEWFYIAIPLFLFCILSLSKLNFKSTFLVISSAIIFIITILRYLYFKNNEPMDLKLYNNLVFSVLYRFDSMMYGMLGAYAFYYHRVFWTKSKYIFLIGSVVFGCFYYIFNSEQYWLYKSVFSFTTTSVIVLFCLPFFNNIKNNNSLLSKSIIYISLISYSLYLSNSVVIYLIPKIFEWKTIESFIEQNIISSGAWYVAMSFYYFFSWFFSILISLIIYKYFELPTTEYLRNRINIKLQKK